MQQQPRRDEKQEKGRDEKGEKQEKNQPSDSLTGLTWGAIFVVAGLIFLVITLGLFPGLGYNAWSLVFLAAGIILLINAAIRVSVPAYRRPVTGTLILAFILLAIGIGGYIGWQNVWPLILIAIGLIILIGQFMRR